MRKPTPIQKILHRVFMLRPVTTFFASRVHQIDKAIFRWTGEKFTGSEILGWNIIQLTTIGAKTKQPRRLPLLGIFDGGQIGLVASSFGRLHNPGWYYNLKAHPECDVQFNGRSEKYIAHEAVAEEYERFWRLAVSFYAGYDKYKQRAAHRHIPLMVLEPKR
jgi:deazaflavin-dependent oxidoreductase (nitroreductase family)